MPLIAIRALIVIRVLHTRLGDYNTSGAYYQKRIRGRRLLEGRLLKGVLIREGAFKRGVLIRGSTDKVVLIGRGAH